MKRGVFFILCIVIFTPIILNLALNGNDKILSWFPAIAVIIGLLIGISKIFFEKRKIKKSPYSIGKSEEILSTLKNSPSASMHGEAIEKLSQALAKSAKVLTLSGEEKTIYDRIFGLSEKIANDCDSASIESETEDIIELMKATNNKTFLNDSFRAFVSTNRLKGNFTYFFGCIAVLFIFDLIAHMFLWNISDIEPDREFLRIAILFLATVLVIVLFIYGKKTKGRVRRLQMCFPYFIGSHETSIANVADKTSIPLEVIQKDLLYIIKKQYFKHAYINYDTNEFFIGMQ